MDNPSNKKSNRPQRNDSPDTFIVDQNMTLEEIRKKFPMLYAELTAKKMSISIDEVKGDTLSSTSQMEEKQDPFSDYDPDIYDFLARATTEEEGFEIIEFLFQQGQISSETAAKLTKKLKQYGIRHFGPLRLSNYYFRKSEEIKSRQSILKRYPSPDTDESKD